MVLSILALIAVYLPGIGVERNGAHRWVYLGFMQFQPSEFAKLSLILYLAVWFENKGTEVRNLFTSTIPFVLILALVGGLVIKEPDMGTTVILALIAGSIYFVAGARMTHVLGMAAIVVAMAWYLIKSAPYRMARFMVFLNPGADSGGQGYHVNQALLAIGSGGILGLGFGKSRQKFNYLPESATDSIFAVVAEELGIIGAGMIVILFTMYAIRGFKIAKESPDIFARLVAVGITVWIVGQSLINIMAILSLMPLTGVPLPFISYGGSSIIMLMFASGILLNISKHTQKGEKVAYNRIGWRNWWSYLPGFGSN
jgi:cell division protein FtsW